LTPEDAMQTQTQVGQSRHATQPRRKQAGARKDSESMKPAESPRKPAAAPRKGPRYGCGF